MAHVAPGMCDVAAEALPRMQTTTLSNSHQTCLESTAIKPPNEPTTMSSPTHKRHSRASSSYRNSSTPYDLAIPAKNPRRSTNASDIAAPRTRNSIQPSRRSSTNTSDFAAPRTRNSIQPTRRTSTNASDLTAPRTRNSLQPSTRTSTLQIPEKAIIVTEQPIHPSPKPSKSPLPYIQATPYTPAPRKRKCSWPTKDRRLALWITLGFAILLAIGIPLGVILPKKLIKPLPINVLVPMSASAENGSWDEIHEAYVSPLRREIRRANKTKVR